MTAFVDGVSPIGELDKITSPLDFYRDTLPEGYAMPKGSRKDMIEA